jgi:hypothetical protein
LRKKAMVVVFAGAEHGAPCTQTGVIGERMTTPRRPLAEAPPTDAAPSRASATARAAAADVICIALSLP